MKTDYNKQAREFLELTNTKLEVNRVPSFMETPPLWAKASKQGKDYGFQYRVTLSNNKGKYSFNFWDSVANKEKAINSYHKAKPTAYDILACLSVYGNDTFEDFCASFGYDTDSINALKTYKEVQDQEENLKRILTDKEIDLLNEIN